MRRWARWAFVCVIGMALGQGWTSDGAASPTGGDMRRPGAGDAWSLSSPSAGFAEATPAIPDPPAMGSALAAPSAMVDDGALLAARGMGERREKPRKPKPEATEGSANPNHESEGPRVLSGRRVRIMLQSVTVPGWGEATLGDRRGAGIFALLELGVWGSFTAFKIQETMRRETYERTASIYAGIDLRGRDEEYRRIVGFYRSSDDYNKYVVRRDAAILYFGDPAAEAAYVDEHQISGDQAWAWDSDASLLRYRAERQATQRSTKRVHDALAAAVVNRLLSMIHASAGALRMDAGRTSWKVECGPTAGDDPTAFRVGLRADF